MQHGIAQKKAKVDDLAQRKRDVEIKKGKDAAGNTAIMQKVALLKKERKTIEKDYSNSGGSMKKSKKKAKHS
jgi:hypothetical protein